MPLIHIEEVRQLAVSSEHLVGGHFDHPCAGATYDGSVLETWGWALGRRRPAVAIEYHSRGRLLRRVPVAGVRNDLRPVFPDVPYAAHAGFRTIVPVYGRQATIQIDVRAVLRDGTRVPFAAISARYGWQYTQPLGASPLVSVVIPCYNQAHYLSQAIESVLSQTYSQIEIVVVDDGSTDNTVEVVGRYPGVRCIEQSNKGLAAARNTGIRRTNGEFLVFLDADDRLVPDGVRIGVETLTAHPEAALVSGACAWISADGSPLPTPAHGTAEGDTYAALLRSNYMGMPATVMYRRGVFEVVRGFDAARSLSAVADYELNLRIARNFPVHAHGKTVAEYRQRAASMSGDPMLMLRSVVSVVKAQRLHLRKDPQLLAAYRDGLRAWRAYYGRPLSHHVSGFAQRGEWRRLLRGIWQLTRCYPAGVVPALRGTARLD